MSMVLAAALALLPSLALGQTETRLRRGDLAVIVHVKGTVVAAETIRLKAEIEGRVEDVRASSYSWTLEGQPLGFLATNEMAAILDSQTTTVKDTVEDRWRRVYQPTAIKCPSECFVLRVFVKNKELVKPRALLFEAAQRVQLVGRVRPEDAHWIKDNQFVDFWPVLDPKHKQRTRVMRYVLDVQATKGGAGGSFASDLQPKKYLDPGTSWEGTINPLTRKGVVIAPTSSLITHEGQAYIAVRVSTGVSTQDYTEISSGGIGDNTRVLVLDEEKLRKAKPYEQPVDEKALRRRVDGKDSGPAWMGDEAPANATSAPPKERVTSVPKPDRTREEERDEKSGSLPDPDATFSEGPDGR